MNKEKFLELKWSVTRHAYWQLNIKMFCTKCESMTRATGPVLDKTHFAACCTICQKPVLIEFDKSIDMEDKPANQEYDDFIKEAEIVDYYPKVSSLANELDSSVPASIREDFMEAKNCLSIRAYNATGAMVRRCLHGVLDEQNVERENLHRRIGKLAEKFPHDPQMPKLAHQLRVMGRNAAHTSDDGTGDQFPPPELHGRGSFYHLLRAHFSDGLCVTKAT